jgi:hypothetical protein
MDTLPIFLTDEQENALRRMEQLTLLRRTRRLAWHQYLRAVGVVAGSGWFFYQGYAQILPGTKLLPGLLSMGMGVFFLGSAFYQFLIVPMRQRIDTLAQLLEEEIKRRH